MRVPARSLYRPFVRDHAPRRPAATSQRPEVVRQAMRQAIRQAEYHAMRGLPQTAGFDRGCRRPVHGRGLPAAMRFGI